MLYKKVIRNIKTNQEQETITKGQYEIKNFNGSTIDVIINAPKKEYVIKDVGDTEFSATVMGVFHSAVTYAEFLNSKIMGEMSSVRAISGQLHFENTALITFARKINAQTKMQPIFDRMENAGWLDMEFRGDIDVNVQNPYIFVELEGNPPDQAKTFLEEIMTKCYGSFEEISDNNYYADLSEEMMSPRTNPNAIAAELNTGVDSKDGRNLSIFLYYITDAMDSINQYYRSKKYLKHIEFLSLKDYPDYEDTDPLSHEDVLGGDIRSDYF